MLSKKQNCKSCVPTCTRANLIGLKFRRYEKGINEGAAVVRLHSHGSERQIRKKS